MSASYAIVIPTVGRPSLRRLLAALEPARAGEAEIIVVDDSADGRAEGPRVLRSGGRGPAAARNVGWRAVPDDVEWVVFLDDDVVPADGWRERLAADLADLPETVGGSQGRVQVPLPVDRRPTDWERNTAGLADAQWITADMAYRRSALVAVGGFDERFRRAYREDADLALRVQDAGYQLVRGRREIVHPVRPAGFWASVRAQAGNADDALMRRRHGRHWRERASETRGRFRRHLLTTTTLLAVPTALALARKAPPPALAHSPLMRTPVPALAAALPGLFWAGLTTEFAAARIVPGPRTPKEVFRMLVTSAVIPLMAVAHRAHGEVRHAGAERVRRRVKAVLFDRDGTLIEDVPYNGDPERVRVMPGARNAVDILRHEEFRLGVVTNQSGIARGLLSPDQVDAVNAQVEKELGPFDVWAICPHDDTAGCACRKPRPGLIHQAAKRLGVGPAECVVVGDIGSDVEAAAAAGASAILIPTPRTLLPEIHRAAVIGQVVPDLRTAVARITSERRRRYGGRGGSSPLGEYGKGLA